MELLLKKITLVYCIWISVTQNLSQKLNGCSIQVVVDPFLSDHLERKLTSDGDNEADVRREIIFFVNKHIGFVNSVLEKYNFSPTGDNLKIFLKNIKILNFSNCNYRGLNYCDLDVSDLLAAHSGVDHSEFCLSYLFTFRDLDAGFLGQAWTASSTRADDGGVCSHFVDGRQIGQEDFEEDAWDTRSRASRGNDTVSQSRNTGLVSFKYNGEMVPYDVSKLVFLHELGHSLGSAHDQRKNCLDSTNGDFVMNPQGCLYGFSHNGSRFSNLSLRNISIAMGSLKTFSRNCFVAVPASVCGNGLVEAWEECDCGENENECKSDPCCYPGNHREFPCQRKPKATCSPSEGKCCTKECKLVGKLDGLVCSEETDCAFSSVCDGTSALCPTPKPKSNSNLCRGGSMTCLNGECGLSICHKFNLVPCKPLVIEKSCEVHCQAPGRPETCEPSAKKYPLFSDPVYHPVNSFCFASENNLNETILGYCSEDHFCQVKPDRPITLESWIIGLIIFLVCYAFIMAFSVWIYCSYCRGKFRFRQAPRG